MRGPADSEEVLDWGDDDWDDWYDDDDGTCDRCDGEGEIMVCIDDLCRGAGECAFGGRGKGCFTTCAKCQGAGEMPAP